MLLKSLGLKMLLSGKNDLYLEDTEFLTQLTFRDNILFGLPYIESRYKQTLLACALQKVVSCVFPPEGT